MVSDNRLAITLEARIRDFERNMAKANRTAGREFGAIEKRGSQSAAKLAGVFKNFGAGLLAGVAAGGVAGIVSQLVKVAEGVANIGNEAQRAGLDIKSFQELKFVAEQNRVGVDALTDGIKELNIRADEFITTGKGSGAEAFARLGYSAADLATKMKDPSALFTEIIGKLGALDKAAQIRIADEIFGGQGGERFVEIIAQGEAGIRDQIRAANDLGVVLDERLIKKAAELDTAFRTISTTVSSNLQTAIIRAADDLYSFIELFQSYDKIRKSSVDEKLAELGMQRLKTENRILEAKGNQALTDRNRAKAIGTYEIELRKIAAEEQKILAARAATNDLVRPTPSTTTTPPVVSSSGSVKTPRDRAAAQVEREADAVRRLIASLQEELSLVGASDQARRAAEAGRLAGAAATDQERQQIVALNEAIYQSEESYRQAAEQSQFFGDAALQAVDSLTGAIQTGNAALDQFLATMIQAVAQAALLGSGPLASLFGGGGLLGGLGGGFKPSSGGFASMLGVPGYASGTNNHPGGLAVVGERGPELINLPKGSQVIPRIAASGGRSGSTVHAPVNVTIDARGADREGLARVEQQVAKLKAELPARIVSTVRTANKTNVKFG